MLTQLETWEYTKQCIRYFNPKDFDHDDLLVDIYARFEGGVAPKKAYIQSTVIRHIIDERRKLRNRLMADYIEWDTIPGSDREPAIGDDVFDRVYWRHCADYVMDHAKDSALRAVMRKLDGHKLNATDRVRLHYLRKQVAEKFPELAR